MVPRCASARRTLLHQMNGLFHTDLQCPDWYGGILNLRPQDVFKHDDPGWETEENWSRIYPNNEAIQERRKPPDRARYSESHRDRPRPQRPRVRLRHSSVQITPSARTTWSSISATAARWAWAIAPMPKPDRNTHDFWYRC